jgi:uncharacterized protein YcbK (DUF882 family)
MSNPNLSRRNAMLTGIIALGATCVPNVSLASLFTGSPRELKLNNLHTGEQLVTRYFDGKNYQRSELKKINHLCRDFRANEITEMDKRLFDQITAIQRTIGCNKQVQIISGYRSPATNKMLSARSSGVAKKSLHMLGQAIDFRLQDVPLIEVKKAALSLQAGGVGYYPNSNFVHIDTGRFRTWG